MKNIYRLLTVTALASLWGCGSLISIHPLGRSADAVLDPSLIGLWSGKDDTYGVTQSDESSYLIRSLKDRSIVLRGQLFEIGGDRVLDLVADEQGPFTVPGHAFARVRRVGNDVELRFIDSEWLQKRVIASGLFYFELAEKPPVTVLTAPTEQVSDFISRFGLAEEALDEPMAFH